GSSPKKVDTTTPVEIILYHTGNEPPKQSEIYENFNKLAKAKLNTTLKTNWLPSADFRTRYPLLFSSGEVFDLAYAATWLNFAQLAKRGAFKPLEELFPAYAPSIYKRESKTALQQATIDGHLYGIPSLVLTYAAYGFVHRTDLNLPGWDGKIETFADIERYLDIVKKNNPGIEPYNATSAGSEADDVFMYNHGLYAIKGGTNDFLFIDPKQPNPKLFTFWEFDKIKDFLAMMKRWSDAGYFPKAALADTYTTKFRDGKAASFLHNVDNWEQEYRRKPEWNIRYSNFVTDMSNLSFTQDTCVVSSSSKNPERALMLYDAILSDQELYRAFYYGIEGKSYNIKVINGKEYIEQTPLVPETYSFTSMWAARTPEFYLPVVGAPPNLQEVKDGFQAMIKEGVGSQKYRSLVIDTSSIETEYANCINAHMQYWWPLELGYGDPVAGLAEYQKQMTAAGIEKVRAVLQAQLDDYVKNYKL
ncbi:MAG: ABC transporter substrate-binding protein, partial [Treponema sp.]|nr:ABC transporter substrate-binding protein [Treponema sp.]